MTEAQRNNEVVCRTNSLITMLTCFNNQIIRKPEEVQETLEKIQAIGVVPVQRCGHGSAIIDKVLYVFGGYVGKGEYLNDIHFCDLTTK